MLKLPELSPPRERLAKKSSFESLDQHIDLIDEGLNESEISVSDSEASTKKTPNIVSPVPNTKTSFIGSQSAI